MDDKAQDKRRTPRIKALFLVNYISRRDGVQQHPVLIGQTLDLGKGGVKLIVTEEIAVGSDMEIHMGVGEEMIPMHGKVVHAARRADGKFTLGIEFDRPIK